MTSKNIRYGFLDLRSAEYLSEAEHRKIYARCDTRYGDLLLTKDGANTGNAAINTLDQEVSLLSSVAFLRFNLRKHDAEFYLQYILSESGQKQIKDLMSGNAITRLTLQKIRKILLPAPQLSEQHSIAAALSDVDNLIAALNALIAKKRAIKQATMQQLLTGKTRLPGFEGEWEACKVEDIADVKTGPFGSVLHESDYVGDGTPIITVEHLNEFRIVHSNLPMVSENDRKRLRAYSLQQDDIVFSRVGSIDRNALVRSSETGWLFSGRLLRVRLKPEKAFAQYLSYQFHTSSFKQKVKNVAVGQTMPSLNTQILKGIDIVLPAVPEQRAIAQILSDMDAEIEALEARVAKTRDIKQGLMQQLLTGRIRLVTPAVEEATA